MVLKPFLLFLNISFFLNLINNYKFILNLFLNNLGIY